MGFLALALANLLKRPLTEPFPFGPPTTPARYRGRVSLDPLLCAGCRICAHVCAAGAIGIEEGRDGLDFAIWHDACAFCGLCAHYCPTGAIRLSTDWHLAHDGADKFATMERRHVAYVPCEGCGKPMLPAPAAVFARAFRGGTPEIERLRRLCPSCRGAASLEGGHHAPPAA